VFADVEEPPVSTVEHPAVEPTEPVEPVEPAVDYDSAHEAEHPRDVLYIKVAAALFVLTGLEVYTSYAHWLGDAFLPILLILMAVKFVLVVLFFMHLKFDAKIFGRLFWAGFFLAVAVYCTALATFHFFAS
jgi:cytochrome c oxidase subunit 4